MFPYWLLLLSSQFAIDRYLVTIFALSEDSLPAPAAEVSVIDKMGRVLQKERNSGKSPMFPWEFMLPSGEYTFRYVGGGTFGTISEIPNVTITRSSEKIYTFRPWWDYSPRNPFGVKRKSVRLGNSTVHFLYKEQNEFPKATVEPKENVRISWNGLVLVAGGFQCDPRRKQCTIEGTIKADCGPNHWEGNRAVLTELTVTVFSDDRVICSARKRIGGLKCGQ